MRSAASRLNSRRALRSVGRNRGGYTENLDLAMAVALLSSYFQQSPPAMSAFVGELCLGGEVRAPTPRALGLLAGTIRNENRGKIRRLYVSSEAADKLRGGVGDIVDVRGVPDLDSLIRQLWPGLFE